MEYGNILTAAAAAIRYAVHVSARLDQAVHSSRRRTHADQTHIAAVQT